jgi:hypothetical protein
MNGSSFTTELRRGLFFLTGNADAATMTAQNQQSQPEAGMIGSSACPPPGVAAPSQPGLAPAQPGQNLQQRIVALAPTPIRPGAVPDVILKFSDSVGSPPVFAQHLPPTVLQPNTFANEAADLRRHRRDFDVAA